MIGCSQGKSMFERYTEPARRVIFFARYEAVQRGSDRITTAHLLLGLVREKDSRADVVGSLRAKIPDPCELLGIPHRPATQIPFDKKAGPPLNDNSKKALAYAAQEADRDQEYWIDTDHLLLALLCFPNEASPALESIPLDLASARAKAALRSSSDSLSCAQTSTHQAGMDRSGLSALRSCHPLAQLLISSAMTCCRGSWHSNAGAALCNLLWTNAVR